MRRPAPSSAGKRGRGKASRRFQASRIEEAYAAWRSAAAIARAFTADDPRRAASRTHLALCHAAGGNAQAARRAFRRALQAWKAADAWVARMGLAHRARSSGFHLRLQAKHPGGYDAVARASYARLLGAGRAAALAGGAHLGSRPNGSAGRSGAEAGGRPQLAGRRPGADTARPGVTTAAGRRPREGAGCPAMGGSDRA